MYAILCIHVFLKTVQLCKPLLEADSQRGYKGAIKHNFCHAVHLLRSRITSVLKKEWHNIFLKATKYYPYLSNNEQCTGHLLRINDHLGGGDGSKHSSGPLTPTHH